MRQQTDYLAIQVLLVHVHRAISDYKHRIIQVLTLSQYSDVDFAGHIDQAGDNSQDLSVGVAIHISHELEQARTDVIESSPYRLKDLGIVLEHSATLEEEVETCEVFQGLQLEAEVKRSNKRKEEVS